MYVSLRSVLRIAVLNNTVTVELEKDIITHLLYPTLHLQIYQYKNTDTKTKVIA